MNQSRKNLYKETSAIGYYEAKSLYNSNNIEEMKSEIIDLANNVNKVYDTIRRHDKPIVQDSYTCFLEGVLQYILYLSMDKNMDGSSRNFSEVTKLLAKYISLAW